MTTARMGKWADADEDSDEDEQGGDAGKSAMFETPVDEHGIKTVISYKEKNGRTYKVTQRVRVTIVTSYTNAAIISRKHMKSFGKSIQNGLEEEKKLTVRHEDKVPVEFSKKANANVTAKDEAEEKFYEESIQIADSQRQIKKSWTDANREKQLGRDEAGVERPNEPDKPSELKEAGAAAAAGTKYLPPSLRGKEGGDAGAKGKRDYGQQESLRVTNLSEDCKEGDLSDLFSAVGRVQRVFLAKDDQGYSRGFAFVTYFSRDDALKAIAKLNGYGYDNLILQVQFAKPRT